MDAKAFQMGRGPLDIKQGAANGAELVNQPDEAYFGGIRAAKVWARKHGFAHECSLDVDPIQTADQLVLMKGFNAVGKAEPVQFGVGRDDGLVDPGLFSTWGRFGAGPDHFIKACIGADLEAIAPDGSFEAGTESHLIKFKNGSGVGAIPADFPWMRRVGHGEEPLCVGVEHDAWINGTHGLPQQCSMST